MGTSQESWQVKALQVVINHGLWATTPSSSPLTSRQDQAIRKHYIFIRWLTCYAIKTNLLSPKSESPRNMNVQDLDHFIGANLGQSSLSWLAARFSTDGIWVIPLPGGVGSDPYIRPEGALLSKELRRSCYKYYSNTLLLVAVLPQRTPTTSP